MKINDKEFRDWTKEDIKVLIENDVFRENNSIDYKVNFAMLECADKNLKKKKQAEFRNDICSFANSDGGYIFFGISEVSGMAKDLIGITISDPDHFELDRRNELQAIQPVTPDVDFSFIPLYEDKYIVVLHIHRGYYKPYITEEKEGEFHFYIRRGNRKQPMSYSEMRNDFLNAVMLSEDIKKFREERLNEYMVEEATPFALLHIIPATFKNQMDYIPMFELFKQGKLNFDKLYNSLIRGQAVPNVDGVYFPDYSELYNFEQLQIFNSGVVELRLDLSTRMINGEIYLMTVELFDELRKLISDTAELYKNLGRSTTMYIGVTIVGSKGYWNYIPSALDAPTQVDRDKIMCIPIEIRNILDVQQVEEGIGNCIRATKYSLGIKN